MTFVISGLGYSLPIVESIVMIKTNPDLLSTEPPRIYSIKIGFGIRIKFYSKKMYLNIWYDTMTWIIC